MVPRFLVAPLISCSSASRSTQKQLIQPCSSSTGAGWGHLCHPEGKLRVKSRDSKRHRRTVGLIQPWGADRHSCCTVQDKDGFEQNLTRLGQSPLFDGLLVSPRASPACLAATFTSFSSLSNPGLESKLQQLPALAAVHGNTL